MAKEKVRYVGPNVEVRIEETGDVVQQNHQVEVDGALAKRLLEQDTWEKAEPGKAKGGSS